MVNLLERTTTRGMAKIIDGGFFGDELWILLDLGRGLLLSEATDTVRVHEEPVVEAADLKQNIWANGLKAGNNRVTVR